LAALLVLFDTHPQRYRHWRLSFDGGTRQAGALYMRRSRFPSRNHVVDIRTLPEDWRRFVPYKSETQRIGTAWLERQSSAALQVPSAISAAEWNLLLNPAHEDFSKIKLAAPKVFTMDPRLP